MSAVCYDAEGNITTVFYGLDSDAEKSAINTGMNYLMTDEAVDPFDYYVSVTQRKVLAKGEKPGEGSVFDPVMGRWSFVLTLAKEARWAIIKARRSAIEFGTLVHEGRVYDVDEVSQRRIQGAVSLALLDPSVTMDWTLANNKTVMLTSSGIKALGGALAMQVSLAHKTARALRKQIDRCTNEIDLLKVVWPGDAAGIAPAGAVMPAAALTAPRGNAEVV